MTHNIAVKWGSSLLTLPLTATSMSASSKTMQGAFPPSSKETCKIIIVVIMKIRSQTEMTAHKASKKDYVPKKETLNHWRRQCCLVAINAYKGRRNLYEIYILVRILWENLVVS